MRKVLDIAGEGALIFEDGQRSLTVNITDEGIIMDCWAVDYDGNDIHVGTRGMTFQEWFDFVILNDPLGDDRWMSTEDFDVTGHARVR